MVSAIKISKDQPEKIKDLIHMMNKIEEWSKEKVNLELRSIKRKCSMQEKRSKRNIMKQAKEKEGVKAKKLAEVKVQVMKMALALKDKQKESLSSN
jgi:hypothetical protein